MTEKGKFRIKKIGCSCPFTYSKAMPIRNAEKLKKKFSLAGIKAKIEAT